MNIIKYINNYKNNKIHYFYNIKLLIMKNIKNKSFEYIQLLCRSIDLLINDSNKKLSMNKIAIKRNNCLKLSIHNNKNNDIYDVNVYIKQDNNKLYYLENIVFNVNNIEI